MKYIVITSKHHDGFALFEFEGEHVQRGGCDAVQARHAEGAGEACAKQACRSASTTRSRRTGTSRTAPATTGTSADQDPIEKS